MIEIMVSLAVMLTALLAFTHSIVASIRATATTRESTVASEAAQRTLEDLLAAEFEDVFALFNADPNDDPGGAGSGFGSTFDVAGLDPQPGDGQVGEIVFPSEAGELRENVQDASLGMPRDLDGDGVIDGDDHAANYDLLPVLVRIRWIGSGGNAQVEFKTVLGAIS